MTDQVRATESIEVEDAQGRLADLLDTVRESLTRVTIQRDGKTIAALISAVDLERLEALDRQRAEGWQTIQAIQARFAHVDPEEIEGDIADAIAEMRAEARAEKATASRT